MDVTVPESRGDDESLAVDDFSRRGNLDSGTGPDRADDSVVYNDRSVLDRAISRRGVNLRSSQCQIGCAGHTWTGAQNRQQQREQGSHCKRYGCGAGAVQIYLAAIHDLIAK